MPPSRWPVTAAGLGADIQGGPRLVEASPEAPPGRADALNVSAQVSVAVPPVVGARVWHRREALVANSGRRNPRSPCPDPRASTLRERVDFEPEPVLDLDRIKRECIVFQECWDIRSAEFQVL